MIPVTKSFLPKIEDYTSYVKQAFDSEWLTNRGALAIKLEAGIMKYLEAPSMFLTNNGTIPLQIALKALGLNGQVITTPFTYVATSAAIVWENCTPVFVDIHPEYLTIDESKIESAITDRTTCILATHVFGNPCNVVEIDRIAQKYGLKVIYDAAHCFGVKYLGKSIFSYGDVSTCSFHATKIFHTGEGGAVFCEQNDLFWKLYRSHNFGHNGPYTFSGVGINGKISELQAAMGLAVLPYMELIISERKTLVELYDKILDFSKLKKLTLRTSTLWNYSYYPVIFSTEELLLHTEARLNELDIYPRRYFYPSLNKLTYLQESKMPISESISSRVLCLPLYVGLKEETVVEISNIVNLYS
jgi:dTDP-4-amino-4,6-dideoxygalactose transaminase